MSTLQRRKTQEIDMQNKIIKVTALTEVEDYPDLSYLDQHKDSKKKEEQKYYEQDQERLQSYNNGHWCMLRVFAKAEIQVPLDEKTVQIIFIESSGLYGVESDSGEDYLKEEMDNQLEELKTLLTNLNCDLSNFKDVTEYKFN